MASEDTSMTLAWVRQPLRPYASHTDDAVDVLTNKVYDKWVYETVSLAKLGGAYVDIVARTFPIGLYPNVGVKFTSTNKSKTGDTYPFAANLSFAEASSLETQMPPEDLGQDAASQVYAGGQYEQEEAAKFKAFYALRAKNALTNTHQAAEHAEPTFQTKRKQVDADISDW